MWNDLIYVGAALPVIIAAFVAVAVWRSAAAQRARRALQEGLASDDAAVRRRTLDGVDDELLSRNIPIFCQLLERETDPDVLDSLAAAVARSRWEPTEDANLIELRRWVAGRHAHAHIDPKAPGSQPPEAVRDQHAHHGVAAPRLADVDGPPTNLDTATPTSTDLGELVPKVRALLGDDLARMELVSIDGQVLASWSSSEPGPGPGS